jgi:hypothetical protein
MTTVGVQPNRVRPRWAGIGLRWRIVLTLSAAVVAAFLVGALFLFEEAAEDKHAIAHRALAEAATTAAAFDREVAASSFLLQGLSRSPALKAGDHRAFYEQLTETPRPDGSWFALWDQEGQVVNTIRPFGTRLPTFAEIGCRRKAKMSALSKVKVLPHFACCSDQHTPDNPLIRFANVGTVDGEVYEPRRKRPAA